MDIKNLIEYQKVDSKLYKIEKDLDKSESKQKCKELSNIAKESQQKSKNLEVLASNISKEIDQLYKIADQNKKKISEILKKDIDKLTEEEIDNLTILKEKIVQNLVLIDKKATKLAEQVNSVLADFNKTIKNYNQAKAKYQEYKAKYDQEEAESKPKIEELRKELKSLEKGISTQALEEYKKRRNDRIFPVLVPLVDKACGRCRMEVSASSIAKLEREGSLVCENCRCIIYKAIK